MDAKRLFLEHFEKLALGIAGFILVIFVVTRLLTPQVADAEREKVIDSNKKITAKAEVASSNAPTPDQLTAVSDVEKGFRSVTEPQTLPPWLFYKRPVVVAKTEGVEIPEPKHFAPTVEPAKGDLGMIGCRWTENTGNHKVKIDKYEVWRAVKEPTEGNWKKVHSTNESTQTSYTDRDVAPKTDYFYQIWSYASVDYSDPVITRAKAKGVDVVLPTGDIMLKSTIIGPIRTLPDVYIQVLNIQLKSTRADILAGKPEQGAEATVKVWKYFPDKKRWLDKLYTGIKPGQMIGGIEPVGNEKRDFTTDFKLLATLRIRVKAALGESDADAIEIEDVKTGEKRVLNNLENDPGLQEVINKKGGLEGDAGEGEGKPEKKPPAGKPAGKPGG